MDEFANGECTYNPAISEGSQKILEVLEAKKERGSDSEGEQRKGRKKYVPEEHSFKPEINQRSKNIKRG